MRPGWMAGVAIALPFGSATVSGAAEIRLAQQFSMGYLQFNVMKRDRLIEKYATQRGLKGFKVSWQRFNGPVAMNEALLSNSTDIVSGGVPGLITLWDKTQGTSFEVKGICALSSQPFLLNTANPDIKSIKDFSERDRIAVPSIKVSVQAVLLQMAAAAAYGEENYAKLDSLTVSMSPPDATIALLSGAGGVSSAFSVPPFQFQQLEQKNIREANQREERPLPANVGFGDCQSAIWQQARGSLIFALLHRSAALCVPDRVRNRRPQRTRENRHDSFGGTGSPCRRLLLGCAGSAAPVSRRDFDPGGLYRRRGAKRD